MRLHRRAAFAAPTLALALAHAGIARAAGPVDHHPLEPADLSSPRAALRSFIDRSDTVFREVSNHERTAAHAQRIRGMAAGVVGCLDLRDVAPSLMELDGWWQNATMAP